MAAHRSGKDVSEHGERHDAGERYDGAEYEISFALQKGRDEPGSQGSSKNHPHERERARKKACACATPGQKKDEQHDKKVDQVHIRDSTVEEGFLSTRLYNLSTN